MPQSQDDHDILIRIDENLKTLVKNFEAHIEDDKRAFDALDKRVKGNERALWSIGGAIAVLNILIQKFFK